MQAVIMSCGLRKDTEQLLLGIAERHALLAAYCLPAARDRTPELDARLVEYWLTLLKRPLARYRWVGCQCLGTANVPSSEAAHHLEKLIVSDPELAVRDFAARALALSASIR